MSSGNLTSKGEITKKLDNKMQELSTSTILFHQEVAQKLHLIPTDHECLDIIMKSGKVTAGELSQTTGLTAGAITGVIDRLEQKGFVRREKDPSDRRKIVIFPNTEKALNEVAPIFASLGKSMEALYNQYSTEQLALILDFVEKSIEIMATETEKLVDKNN